MLASQNVIRSNATGSNPPDKFNRFSRKQKKIEKIRKDSFYFAVCTYRTTFELVFFVFILFC